MAVRFQRTAVAVPGKGAEAMAFAAEVAEYFTTTFGVEVTWGMEIGGTYGRLHWFVDYDDLAQFEAVNLRGMGDHEYVGMLARGEQLFLAGQAEDTLVWSR
jgi:hypothetical protein